MTQREIIFRGKRIPDGLWLYGSLDNRESEFVNIRPSKKEFVLEGVWMARQVDPATVGQYTGLKDKHGEKIFEGDKVHWCNGEFVIEWGELGWVSVSKSTQVAYKTVRLFRQCGIIGNIHEETNT